MIDDKQLYSDFLNGSIEAFETLVITYKDPLIYFISRYTGNDLASAEDIAQDVFAFIYVYKEKYNFKFSFKTYLFTLGKNKAIDFLRKQSKLQLEPYDTLETINIQHPTLEQQFLKNEENQILIDNFKKLKADYQRPLYLYVFEGLSYKEIAKVLGKSLPQVKILIYRARNVLKTLMEEEGIHYEK
jgi:RNA polymerase sigma-70 factor (ECF subfamily)